MDALHESNLPAAAPPADEAAAKATVAAPAAEAAATATPAPPAAEAAATAPSAMPAAETPAAPAEEEEAPRFAVGELVEVKARTFPGFNKAGGTATIRKVLDERNVDGGKMKDGSRARTTGFTYAIKYVLNGSEKRVDAQWISAKVEVTREAAADLRREEAEKRKAEREAEEARKAQEEAERRARKRGARLKVAQLRAAKKARVPPAKKARVAIPSGAAAAPAAAAAPPPPPVAEEPADVKWLRGVLASAPRDVPDEVDLDALFEAAASTPSPPGVCVFGQAALRALLGQLEADNQIMVVDATIYLV